MCNFKLNVSAGAVFMLAALYFFGGLNALAVVFVSAFFHELGHIVAIKAFGGKIRKLNFDASGFCMSYYGIDSTQREAIALLSGPLFGFAFAYLASYCGNKYNSDFLYQSAGVSLIFSVFNLLPALPLDGGRALFCLIPDRIVAEKVLDYSGMITGIVLVTTGLYFLGQEKGAAFLVSGVWVLIAQTGIVKNFGML